VGGEWAERVRTFRQDHLDSALGRAEGEKGLRFDAAGNADPGLTSWKKEGREGRETGGINPRRPTEGREGSRGNFGNGNRLVPAVGREKAKTLAKNGVQRTHLNGGVVDRGDHRQ